MRCFYELKELNIQYSKWVGGRVYYLENSIEEEKVLLFVTACFIILGKGSKPSPQPFLVL